MLTYVRTSQTSVVDHSIATENNTWKHKNCYIEKHFTICKLTEIFQNCYCIYVCNKIKSLEDISPQTVKNETELFNDLAHGVI